LELKDAAVTGTGNSLGNFLWGNDANNVLFGMSGDDALFGGSGIDSMEGGAGNDIYHVDAARDQVIEAAGEGSDTVYTSVSYALGASAAVETLRTTSTSATTAINLTGNSFANTLMGNAGANKLNGNGGADTMVGYAGSDTYHVDSARDMVKETSSGGTADRVYTTVSYTLAANVENLYASGSASLRLIGTTKNNTICGNAGANKINGGYGNDVLKGGLGKDAFIFSTKLSATGNLDRIVGFNVKDDSLFLENAIFTKLGLGSMSSPKKLASSFFTVGDEAKDANDYVIDNKTTGVLYYDADGSRSGKAVEVAKLSKGLAMTYNDIYVV
jgi:Ca2+-binding RTX toxin-like protein